MTLNNFIIRLEEAWCKTAMDVWRWLEVHDITQKEAIALKYEIKHAGKADELWEVYYGLTMYIKYNKDS